MKLLTHFLQDKYNYVLFLIDANRKDFFTRLIPCRGDHHYDYLIDLVYSHEDMLDPDTNIYLHRFEFQTYIDCRESIKAYLYDIMVKWNMFNQYQRKIIKQFEEQKKPLKIKAYHQQLRHYFCYDVNSIIISYLI